MTRYLRPSFVLFAVLPLGLHAQVLAGDATGLAHTAVGIVLSPAYGPFPMTSSDTASIDLEGDGWMDLQFHATNMLAFDAYGSGTGCSMLHEGVEVVVDAPGGYVAQRLNGLDPVNNALNWRAWSDVTGNSLALASLYTNFAGQWDTTGAEQWLANGAVATQGYLGVRIVDANDTLYGWVNLISYVSQDSAWLQLDDFAIEMGTTAIAEESTNGITALLSPNGMLVVKADEGEVLHMVLRDGSGRAVREHAAPAPCTLDMAGEAGGIHVLTVSGQARTRSFKLAW